MDPIIEQMLRVRDERDVRYDVVRRWACYLRDVVQPQLDELDALKADPPPKGKAA